VFRNRPYWGWLIAGLLLWGIAIGCHRRHMARLRPAAMAALTEEYLRSGDASVSHLLQDSALIRRIFERRLTDEEAHSLVQLPFYLFAYQGDSLMYWNSNNLLPPAPTNPDTVGHLVFQNNQYCIRKTFLYPVCNGARPSLAVLLPIKVVYPFENQHLHDHFTFTKEIPLSTALLSEPAKGTYAITNNFGRHWLSMRFDPQDTAQQPENSTLIAFVAALLVSLLWLQLNILCISRRHSWRKGFLLTVLLVLGLRFLFKDLPLPFGISDLPLFSPVIYGYSWLLASLGDLLLNELVLVWIIVFVLAETPYHTYFKPLKSRVARVLAALLLLSGLPVLLFELLAVLHSLVIDSQISFDVGHFHTVDAYTVIGLVAIALGLITAAIATRLIKAQLYQLIPARWLRLGLVAASCIVFTVVFHPESVLFYMVIFWVVADTLLLDIMGESSGSIFTLQMIFVSLFTCACATLILHDLVRTRDLQKDRIAYAEHLLAQQDPLMEYNFKSIVPRLQQDPGIMAFLAGPNAAATAALARRLNVLYFNTLINRYQPAFYLFDRTGRALYNMDTASEEYLRERFETGMPTQEDHLVLDVSSEGYNYLAHIPFDSSLRPGNLYITLSLKKNINETVYPELLQPETVNRIDKEGRYAYAIYLKGKRITQTSDYNFPPFIDTAGGVRRPIIRKIKSGDYELRYQEARDNVVIVAGSTGSWFSSVMLFSYLFGVHLLLSFIALLYQWLFRLVMRVNTRPIHLSLRQRIHLGTVIILLISFVTVGIATVAFFKNRYKRTSRASIQATTQIVERYVRQYLAAQGGLSSRAAMDSVARTPEFRYSLYSLAAGQKTDANVFDYGGRLLVASQEDLYEHGLLAPVMRPQDYRRLQQGSSIVEENEYVGNFQFLSCSVPVRNDEGTILGYVSVPFFSSERELNDQISNIVVALVNLYAFLFFLSSFLALFISERLARTFNVLINQFGRLSLQQNELLVWPYNDEIGVLVGEYNKMVRKVEESAAMLARNERESAWREMAKQVAHEIKNPLTPMKLNIQYLQQALQSKRPDIERLAAKVSASIIEQIDNLAYIASEFSNFATMPEAKATLFSMNDLLQRAIPLYQSKQGITVTLTLPEEELIILADHSQLLRVFTNLMQNAIQAVPEDTEGRIDVVLLHDGGDALVQVSDNGTGISAEAAAKIFKPYFTTKSSGTGLGLAMSRKILELWKGKIWYESQEGVGTTFFIRLPVVENAGSKEA
jgi:signal transduction histidine kinase